MELHKKDRKAEKILDKVLLNSSWGPIVVVLSVVYFIGGRESDFSNLIKIICATLSVVISIIIYSKIPNIKNDFVKYLGGGFLYSGCMQFVELFIIANSRSESILSIVSITITFFELSIIIYSLILYKKNVSLLASNLVFVGRLIIIFVMIKYTIYYFVDSSGRINDIGNKSLHLICMMIIINAIITICLVLKDKRISYKEDKTWLIIIIVLFSAYGIIIFGDSKFFIDIIYPKSIFRLLAYVTTYKYVEEKLLNNSYRYTLDKLIVIQKTRRAMNNNLMEKERRLRESRMNIQKSEERYEEIIESISEGILIFENNKLMYINEKGIEHLSYKLSEKLIDINLKRVLNLKYVLNLLTSDRIKNNEIDEGFSREFVIENSERKKFNISLILKNTSDVEKILLIKNVTRNDELQSLRQQRDKAKVMESIKDEFYSNISHELRTPINVLNSALQLNNLMLENNKLDKMVKNNNIIRRNCLRLIRTINNFIDTNRISENFLEPNKKVYNIVSIIEDVVLACNKYMILMDNELVFDTDSEDIYIACDIDHIERIMLNILSNSLKYGRVGGNIDVRIKSTGNEVKILVINDAPSIPKEKKKLIFEKFTKLDSSLARPSEGSGLGLYLTKKLVELNGGTIRMNDNIENGNIFDIRFPFKFAGEHWEVDKSDNHHNLQEKVNIEFSDIYFD